MFATRSPPLTAASWSAPRSAPWSAPGSAVLELDGVVLLELLAGDADVEAPPSSCGPESPERIKAC